MGSLPDDCDLQTRRTGQGCDCLGCRYHLHHLFAATCLFSVTPSLGASSHLETCSWCLCSSGLLGDGALSSGTAIKDEGAKRQAPMKACYSAFLLTASTY